MADAAIYELLGVADEDDGLTWIWPHGLQVEELASLDETPPTITLTTSATIASAGGTLGVEIEGYGDDVDITAIWVIWETLDAPPELVWDSTGFQTGYDAGSSETDLAFVVDRDDPWPDEFTLAVLAVDDAGNDVREDFAITVTGIVTPAVTLETSATIASVGGTVDVEIAGTDTRDVQIWAVFASLGISPVVIYDGAGFTERFDAASTHVGQLFHIAAEDAWPADFDLVVRLIDGAGTGSEVTETFAIDVTGIVVPAASLDSSSTIDSATGELEVSFVAPDVLGIEIWAEWDGLGISPTVIYDGTGFTSRFNAGSTLVGQDFTILNEDPWPADFDLKVRIYDAAGGATVTTNTFPITVTGIVPPDPPDSDPPTVELLTDPSIAAAGGIVKLRVPEDDLALAFIWADYPLLGRPPELLYEIEGKFKQLLTGSTEEEGSLVLTIRRSTTWPGSFTLWVAVADEDGNFEYYDFAITVTAAGAFAGGGQVAGPTPEDARDILLDPTNGWRPLLVEGGPVYATGAAAIRQSLTIGISMFLGEWFLDQSLGFPWFELVLGIPQPNLPAIREALRQRILAEPGVNTILSLRLDFSSETRMLDVSFAVDTDLGELVITVPTPVP